MYTYAQRYVTDTVSVLMSVNLLHTVRAFCWCKNNHSWPKKKKHVQQANHPQLLSRLFDKIMLSRWQNLKLSYIHLRPKNIKKQYIYI